MYVLRKYDCEVCGRPTERKRHAADPRICVDCGMDRAESAARQMASKKGPYWDAFILSAGINGRPKRPGVRR